MTAMRRFPVPSLPVTVIWTLAAGVLLRFATGLEPIAWLTWIAPVPLLLLAFALPRWRALLAVTVAALIATSAYLTFFRLVMPLPAALAAMTGQALLWVLVVMLARRVVLAFDTPWTVLAYPLLWVAVDMLQALTSPDGNWGSVAYTQSDVLAFVQIAAIGGVPAMLFVLGLVPSCLAMLAWRRGLDRRAIGVVVTVVVIVAATFGYGAWRLGQPLEGTSVRVGIVSIDDAIGPNAKDTYALPIRDGYDALVARVAGEGATLVVLPEKIATLRPDVAEAWKAHFGTLAATHRVWLEVGLGIDDGTQPRNRAWLYDPQGVLVQDYEKHLLAPPERFANYGTGDAFNLHPIGGTPYGLAICKDMHFAAFGRDYGQRGAGVMLVPAWDFAYLDAWLEARTTVLRGVENGYAVVRAAREGLLTVSDAHGRVIAEAPSAAMPGAHLVTDLVVGPQIATPYTRIGPVLGWIGLAFGALVLLPWRLLRRGSRR